MPFAEDQHLIQAVAPQRPNQPLKVRIFLPRRRSRDRSIPYAHGCNAADECTAIAAIPIARGIAVGRRPGTAAEEWCGSVIARQRPMNASQYKARYENLVVPLPNGSATIVRINQYRLRTGQSCYRVLSSLLRASGSLHPSVKSKDCWKRMASAVELPAGTVPSI